MKKILLPYDGSASAKRAVTYLAEKLKGNAAVQVHLINVQEVPMLVDPYIGPSVLQDVEQALKREGEKAVLEAAKVLQEASVPHQLHVHLGLVPDVIAKQAELLGCEAIVMGTRGRGTFSGLVLGSVAMKVVHLAYVPVTLIK